MRFSSFLLEGEAYQFGCVKVMFHRGGYTVGRSGGTTDIYILTEVVQKLQKQSSLYSEITHVRVAIL